jgi:hypothetical protein
MHRTNETGSAPEKRDINSTMTKQQLYLFGCLYLTILAVVVVLTRATPRRLAGALVGAAVMGGAGLGIVAIGESARWWHFVMTWEPYFLTLMWIGMIPCGFIFLITWRIGRRFGGREEIYLRFTLGGIVNPGSTSPISLCDDDRAEAPWRAALCEMIHRSGICPAARPPRMLSAAFTGLA